MANCQCGFGFPSLCYWSKCSTSSCWSGGLLMITGVLTVGLSAGYLGNRCYRPFCHFFTFPLFPHCLSFLIFCPPCVWLHFFKIYFVFYFAFLVFCHTSMFIYLLTPSVCVSPQLHPQWELFLLPAFCERATRSASPALSLGTLCKSVCVCTYVKLLNCFVLGGSAIIKCYHPCPIFTYIMAQTL